MRTRRTLATLAALVLAWCAAYAGSGLNNRTHRLVLFLYSQYGTVVDTTGEAEEWVRSYSSQYDADTTGHSLEWTVSSTLDGVACWYRDDWETDIVDIYWDSAGTIVKLYNDYLVSGRTLGDSMVVDSLVLGPNVVRRASIVDDAVNEDKIELGGYPFVPGTPDTGYVFAFSGATWAAGPLDTAGVVTANWEAFARAAVGVHVACAGLVTLSPSTGAYSRIYCAHADSGDGVIATWLSAPFDSVDLDAPIAVGTGYRGMPISAYVKTDTVYIGSGAMSTWAGGDSVATWMLINLVD